MFAMKTGILMVVAAFAAMPTVAWQQVGVDAGVSEFADGEATAVAVVGELDDAPALYTVSANAENTCTNEFEVWFCTDQSASPAFCDFVFGVDCGRLFARGCDLRSVVFDDSTLQTNSVAVVLRFERKISGETINDAVELNGEDCAFLAERFADAHPDEWRSVKIISRDAGEVSPTVSIMRRKIGTSIHLAAVR